MTAVPTSPTTTDPQSPSPDDVLVAALETVMPRYHSVLRRALFDAEGDDRLTFPQLRCLQVIANADGPSLASRLARTLLVTPPTMTRTIDGLAERGLVTRQPDPVNRRQIGLVITPEGRALLAHYEKVIADRLRDLLAPLDAAARWRLLAALGDLGTLLAAEDQTAGERA
jgi:DNA-binding MarR family transcriptional regulator